MGGFTSYLSSGSKGLKIIQLQLPTTNKLLEVRNFSKCLHNMTNNRFRADCGSV